MALLQKIKSFFGTKKTSTRTRSPNNGKNNALKGEIIHFNYRKGYGFVDAPDCDKRVFLHVSELSGKAKKGKMVEFVPEFTDKGIKATKAVVLN